MTSKQFKVGDIVVFTPTETVLKQIERLPYYEKYVGKKAVILVIYLTSSQAAIQYLDTQTVVIQTWGTNCLTHEIDFGRKLEISGEV